MFDENLQPRDRRSPAWKLERERGHKAKVGVRGIPFPEIRSTDDFAAGNDRLCQSFPAAFVIPPVSESSSRARRSRLLLLPRSIPAGRP